jgi:hypothetical protein
MNASNNATVNNAVDAAADAVSNAADKASETLHTAKLDLKGPRARSLTNKLVWGGAIVVTVAAVSVAGYLMLRSGKAAEIVETATEAVAA